MLPTPNKFSIYLYRILTGSWVGYYMFCVSCVCALQQLKHLSTVSWRSSFKHTISLSKVFRGWMPLHLSVNEEACSWDPEYMESFKRIAPIYLVNKFKDCQGNNCRLFCSQRLPYLNIRTSTATLNLLIWKYASEVESLLKSILPPVSKDELDKEV